MTRLTADAIKEFALQALLAPGLGVTLSRDKVDFCAGMERGRSYRLVAETSQLG